MRTNPTIAALLADERGREIERTTRHDFQRAALTRRRRRRRPR